MLEGMAMKHTDMRKLEGFTSVDQFLSEQGKLAQFEALAKSEVLEWQAKGGAKGGKSAERAATWAVITAPRACEGK
jgi:hypothetical protein